MGEYTRPWSIHHRGRPVARWSENREVRGSSPGVAKKVFALAFWIGKRNLWKTWLRRLGLSHTYSAFSKEYKVMWKTHYYQVWTEKDKQEIVSIAVKLHCHLHICFHKILHVAFRKCCRILLIAAKFCSQAVCIQQNLELPDTHQI